MPGKAHARRRPAEEGRSNRGTAAPRSKRHDVSRRRFLQGLAVGSGGLALARLSWGPTAHAQGGLQPSWDPASYDYSGWEDLYRAQWTFDAAGRSTHSVNCTGSCSWKVLVRKGVVWRDEQAADYPAIAPDLPDYNPRGCQKGACAADWQYGRQRIKYPLKRVGERGEGKWQRLSWDEALDEIADRTLDILQRYGPEYLNAFTPIPAMSPVSYASGSRLMNLLGGVSFTFYDWYCDLPPGEPITWGVQTDSAESADWTHSRYILVWGSNVNVTRIPDAQMLHKARLMRGAKVVVVSTDYNATCVHADQFVPVRAGSDTAVALAMDHVVVNEGLYDEAYVKEQTDLPLLVRRDSGRFLRQADVEGTEADDADTGGGGAFYLWDADRGLTPAPADGLDLGDLDPALEGTFEVELGGATVRVSPVFELLRDELADKTPAWAQQQSGLNADTIASLAREFAAAEPAMILHGAGTNQWYHNDLANRAMILLAALTGNVGKPGGGFHHYVGQEKIWPIAGWKALAYPGPQRFQNTTLWTYWHSQARDTDPMWPELQPYLEASVRDGWMPLWPNGLEDEPKAFFIWRANWLNQAKANPRVLEKLWPKLELIVAVDFRMSSTDLYADYVLPAATWPEKWDLSSTDLTSFLHPFTPVVEPFAEARTDWQAFRALAEALERRARARGYEGYDDTIGGATVHRDLTTLHAQFTSDGALAGDKAAAQFILDNAVETRGMTMDDLVAQPRRFHATSEHWTSDLEEGRAYAPFERYVRDRKPWPTMTGRQQFYIDAPWYLELGVALPTYKPPLSEGDHPLRLNTPHYRHTIHSSWSTNTTLQRLQRGEPYVVLSLADAADRGIEDHDWVRVFNDNGATQLRAKVQPGEPPGVVLLYQGWEMAQFADRNNFQAPIPLRINPTQLVRYGHLRFAPNYWGPTGANRDARVEVEKIS